MVQGRVVYISDDNYSGEDSFEYWITSVSGEKLKGRVVLQVKGNTVSRELALTGADSSSLAITALALLALGLLAVCAVRRRDDEAQ